MHRTCNGAFVSFPFFLQNIPFSTTRCQTKTVNPWFNETFSVKQVITEDFIDYIAHNALEVELWGAPDSKIEIGDHPSAKAKYGDEIQIDETSSSAVPAEEEEEEVDVAFLNEQLEDSKHELKVLREVGRQEKEKSATLLKQVEENLKLEAEKWKDVTEEYKQYKLKTEKEIETLKKSKACNIM